MEISSQLNQIKVLRSIARNEISDSRTKISCKNATHISTRTGSPYQTEESSTKNVPQANEKEDLATYMVININKK